jgi:hypothetical protein
VYALLRRIHALTGILLSLFALTYAISGAAILYADRLPATPPVETTETFALPSGAASSDELLPLLEESVGAWGRLVGPTELDDGSVRYRWNRAGVNVQADVAADGSRVTVTRSEAPLLGKIKVLHLITGYEGGPGFALWAFFLDLVGIAMIGFAASGIVLWHRLARDRRLGWFLLTGSWGYTTFLLVYLMVS